jgi:hypothetical protein
MYCDSIYLDNLALTKPPVKSAAHFKKLPLARFFTSDIGEKTAVNDDAFPVAIRHSSSSGSMIGRLNILMIWQLKNVECCVNK